MLKVPVANTLAAAAPLIVPKKALEITATLAGPPALRPAMRQARSMKYWPSPSSWIKAPKITNRATKTAETPVIDP